MLDLKKIKFNYKKPNVNDFEKLQYLHYILVPQLGKQLLECEVVVNQKLLFDRLYKAEGISIDRLGYFYISNILNITDMLKDIVEVKKVSLKEFPKYKSEFATILDDFNKLLTAIKIFRIFILKENIISQILNGIKIFNVETSIIIAQNNLALIIEHCDKRAIHTKNTF